MKTRLAALTVLAAALCGCGKMADNAAAARQSAESFLAAMCAGEAGDAYDEARNKYIEAEENRAR